MKDLTKQLKSLYKIQPSTEWKVSARKDILAKINSENSPYEANRWAEFLYCIRFSTGFFHNFIMKPAGTMILALLLVSGGGILKVKADSSLPGDLLYALKRSGEKAQMVLVFNKDKKSELQLALVDERVKELNIILSKDDIRDNEMKQAFDNFHKDFTPVRENLADSNIAKKIEDRTSDFQYILAKAQKNVAKNSKKDVNRVIAEINKVNFSALEAMAIESDSNSNDTIAEKIHNKIGETSEKAKNSAVSAEVLAKLDKAKDELSDCNFVMALQIVKESTEILNKTEETTDQSDEQITEDIESASTTIDILEGDDNDIENATSSDELDTELEIDKDKNTTSSTDNILE
ncbi:MAG: DUF5667 domain-containing protein [Patescibacteria group bacterium]|nr:DUF5667 domain-containing protein [Patescibacteria group bacterium]